MKYLCHYTHKQSIFVYYWQYELVPIHKQNEIKANFPRNLKGGIGSFFDPSVNAKAKKKKQNKKNKIKNKNKNKNENENENENKTKNKHTNKQTKQNKKKQTNKQTKTKTNKEKKNVSVFICAILQDSPILQSARPRVVALASYTVVDKIIKNTVGFTRKDIWNYFNLVLCRWLF